MLLRVKVTLITTQTPYCAQLGSLVSSSYYEIGVILTYPLSHRLAEAFIPVHRTEREQGHPAIPTILYHPRPVLQPVFCGMGD